ncbi:hypothetical protein [Mycobacteroides abscessus]|uniref:hypothetical protein n=1 Tax=Mycobacteroides abscessus TaxID=36809 RepID=UPI001F3AA640
MTDLLDGALVVAGDKKGLALRALTEALGGAEGGSALATLSAIGFKVDDHQVPGALVVNGFRGVFDDTVEKVLAALAPYADDGGTMMWEDDNGCRWRHLLTGGTIIEQSPVVLWRDVGDRATRVGGVVAEMTVVRNHERYEAWWAGRLPQRDDLIAVIEVVRESESVDLGYALHSLMLDVFQNGATVDWLDIGGMRRGVVPSYITLDIDLAHDSDGVYDGVDIVLSLHAPSEDGSLMGSSVSVYVDRPERVLVPDVVHPGGALADLIDTALALINAEIAERDRFCFAVRDVLT